MKLVVIESPFAGNVVENIKYARRAVRDSILRGECPIASHLLYTQPGILNDDNPSERALGIGFNLYWSAVAELTAVYADYGVTDGMQAAIDAAARVGRRVEYRSIKD